MVKKLFIVACALVVIGAVAAGALYYAYPVQVSIFGALTRNYLITGSHLQARRLRNRMRLTGMPGS
jgi:hypothetical protein